MKPFLTIWITTVLIQEVFTSTLVRLPPRDVTKPTSSVHTEYEATYQQKGKLGNGSYSTVSGKQEVVHDNCGDNWNAFADKCATLIKDLVASLANAVSSKPGDATNLQLRIKNTFKHFDSTDNCTCLNHTANGLTDLASLFDNITINTLQPNANAGSAVNDETDECKIGSCKNDNGENKISSTYQDNNKGVQKHLKPGDRNFYGENNNDYEKPLVKNPKIVEQRINHPNPTLANNEGVNPEFFDSSKELLSNNSRRQTKYPEVILSGHPDTTDSNVKQLSPSSIGSNRILSPSAVTPARQVKTVGSPTEVTNPQSQPKNNIPKSIPSTPQQNFLKPALPSKNNNIPKSDIFVNSAPSVPSSASQMSSPQEVKPVYSNTASNAGFSPGSNRISGMKSDALTPVVPFLKTANNIAPNDGERRSDESNFGPNQNPVMSIPFKTYPLNKPGAEPITVLNGKVGYPAESTQSPVVTPIVPSTNPVNGAPVKPQMYSNVDEDFSKGNGESNQTSAAGPIISTAQPVTAVVAKAQVSPTDEEESITNGSNQVVIPVASMAEPAKKIANEPIPNKDDIYSKETNNGSKLTPAVAPFLPTKKPVNGAPGHSQIPIGNSEGNGVGSSQTSIVTPVVPTAQPVNEPMTQPQILFGNSGGKDEPSDQTLMVAPNLSTTDAVRTSVAEPQDILNNDEENGESNQTPVVSPGASVAQPIRTAVAQSQIPLGNNGRKEAIANQAPVDTPILSTADPVSTNLVESQVAHNNDEDYLEENNGIPSQTPVVLSLKSTAKPVNGAVYQPEISTAGSGGNGAGSNRVPSVGPTAHLVDGAESKPQIAVTDSSSSEDRSEESKDGSKQIPVGTPIIFTAQPVREAIGEPQVITNPDKGYIEENNGKSEQTPVISPEETTAKSDNGAAPESQISSIKSGENIAKLNQNPIVTPFASISEPINEAARESQTTPNNDENFLEESKDGSNKIPMSTQVASTAQPVNGAIAQPQTSVSGNRGKDVGSNQTPMITPVESTADLVKAGVTEPQSVRNNKKNDEECAEGNDSGTDKTEVVKPETLLFPDSSAVLLDKNVNSASNPNSDFMLAIPAVNSTPESNFTNDSGETEALGQIPAPLSTKSDGPALPEDVITADSVNVIPDLVVKQPEDKHLAQKSPSSVVPIINSNSNLPGSEEPVGSVEIIYPPPINQPLPITPSPVLPPSAAIIKKGPAQAIITDKDKNVFIVTPIPAYPEKIDPVVSEAEDKSLSAVKGTENFDKPTESEKIVDPNIKPPTEAKESSSPLIQYNKSQGNQPLIAPVSTATTPIQTAPANLISENSRPQSELAQTGDYQPIILLTTPTPVQPELVPVRPSKANENFVQQHPLLSTLKNQKSEASQPQGITNDKGLSKPNSQSNEAFSNSAVVDPVNYQSSDIPSAESQPKSVVEPVMPVTEISENSDLTKPTTFQTTSTDPTPPQKIIPFLNISTSVTQSGSTPQDSYETAHEVPTNSPQTIRFNDDDDDDEDCCSCESCTEEEIANPKQYKEMACKDLEEARKELKAIFDKIKKKLKCGRKAPQKIVTS